MLEDNWCIQVSFDGSLTWGVTLGLENQCRRNRNSFSRDRSGDRNRRDRDRNRNRGGNQGTGTEARELLIGTLAATKGGKAGMSGTGEKT